MNRFNTAKKNIYFIHDVPEAHYKGTIYNKLAEARRHPGKNAYETASDTQKLEQQQFVKSIKALQMQYPFITLDPTETMSDESGNILIIEQGNPVYYDDNHLTDYGSIRFREAFMPLIDDILAKQQADIAHD